jgi:hypothetical protein
MTDIETTLADMEAYVETHAKGWGSKDAAKDHLSQHALCWLATQKLPRLIAAVRVAETAAKAMEDSMNFVGMGRSLRRAIESALTGNAETTGTESNDES